jgi:hypothetical protein
LNDWRGRGPTILHVHLDRRSIGRLAHPKIEILSFSSLEEKYVVAVVEFGEFIQLVELRFRV